MIADESSENMIADHFVEINKTINVPKSATKDILDYELSRHERHQKIYLLLKKASNKLKKSKKIDKK